MGNDAASERWRERFEQAMARAEGTAAADVALGALFFASHHAHHALAELEARLDPRRGAPERGSHEGVTAGELDASAQLRVSTAALLHEICAAGDALGRALHLALSRPAAAPAPVEALELQGAVRQAHALLGELVTGWHATTDGQASLADFAVTLAAALGALPPLAHRIAPGPT